MSQKPLWYKVARQEAWTRQKSRCAYCLTKLRLDQVTADHVIPKSKGGLNQKENIIAACRTCNLIKGSMTVNQFKNKLKSKKTENLHIRIQGSIRRINLAADRSCARILAFAR